MVAVIVAILGGFISRDCGNDRPIFRYGLSQFIYALPYGIALALAGLHISAAIAYAGAVMGKRTSHGQYIGSGKNKHPESKHDRIDPFVKLFFGAETDDNFWRNQFGLAVTGLLCTIPFGVLWAVQVDLFVGLTVGLSGMSKAVAYAIGWAGNNHIDKRINPTYVGEVLTGVFGWGTIYYLVIPFI